MLYSASLMFPCCSLLIDYLGRQLLNHPIFFTFVSLSAQVSPDFHVASTTPRGFLALLRLSSALSDPVLVPSPPPFPSPFSSPLLLSFPSSLPSPLPSCVCPRIPVPVPTPDSRPRFHLALFRSPLPPFPLRLHHRSRPRCRPRFRLRSRPRLLSRP